MKKDNITTQPPRHAKALLRRLCPIDFLEEIEGDLEERFFERLPKRGKFVAALAYWRDVIHCILTTSDNRINRKQKHAASRFDLLKHFMTVSIRQLQRSRSTTFINISGLSVSIACFLFILFYLIKETTYDAMHPDAENVYRISHSYRPFGEGEITDARVPGLWTVTLKEAMPEIIGYTRFSRFGYPGTVKYEKKELINVEQEFFWVDSTYTDIFSLPMVSGENPVVILRNPTKVILNERKASQYFGTDDPVGQTIIYSRDGLDIPLIVAGVMKNYPSNTHFHPDFLANSLALTALWNQNGDFNSSYTDGVDRINSWNDAFTYSYIRVSPGTDMLKVDETLRNVLKTHLKEKADSVWPTITKLTDIHFRSGFQIELETPGDRIYLYLFGSIGILILFVACINYMNISTAKSLQRSKEVGLRKALGIKRTNLILQFIGESIIITTISSCIAIALMALLLPAFNNLSPQSLTIAEIVSGKIWILLVGLVVVIGFIAGSYPAFYLSAFKPIDVLRGKLRADGGAERLRKSLVVFQFIITLLLVVGTLVIRNQLSFINKAKLSEFKDQILTIRLFGVAHPKYIESFSEIIKRQANVDGVSTGTQIPRQEGFGWMDVRLRAPELDKPYQVWKYLEMDTNFPSLFDLEFSAGRNFSILNPADTGKIIINEAAMKYLNITSDRAVGLILEDEFNHEQREIIGVVKDFSYSSIRNQIEPLAISGKPNNAEVMYIKLSGDDLQSAIASIQKAWKKIIPNAPFQYWFLDEEFDRLYKVENSTGALFLYFSILAIFIGCLGLLGLASFTIEQKTKEIGIRKVLGATAVQIWVLLTSRFIKLTTIAVLIGTPPAYYLVNTWLHRFAYKATLHWSVFVASGIFLMLITCVTVGLESAYAAFQNPAKSLRHE